MTNHKQKALYLLGGFFFGCFLTYMMFSHIVSNRVQDAFDFGVEVGLHYYKECPHDSLINNY